MKEILILSSFERSLKKLTPRQKKEVAVSLESFNSFLATGQLTPGLGFKKINHDKYELRVDIRLRIVIKMETDICYLILVGSHDEVKRYLRNYR